MFITAGKKKNTYENEGSALPDRRSEGKSARGYTNLLTPGGVKS
jgi:hypothetical protein